MNTYDIRMKKRKRIALIAHDGKKEDLIEWVKYNKGTLEHHQLFATRSTGRMVMEETGLEVTCFLSGPIGGDLQMGAKIAEGEIDFLIFFWDPLTPQPHDPDVKALLRIAVQYNIPTASNRATADFLISSPLMKKLYTHSKPIYE